MASALHRVVGNFRDAVLKMSGVLLSDTAGSTGVGIDIMAGSGAPSGAYGRTSTVLVYFRTDASTLAETLAISVDTGTSWMGWYSPSEVADPGDAAAIPVTAQDAVVHIVTAGAETRTVADPTSVGQRIAVYFLTDAGNAVITFASPVNVAGNNTLTLADAGETVFFEAIRDGGSAFHWHVVGSDLSNGTLTTV